MFRNLIILLMLLSVQTGMAQRFFNLTADEVDIDSIMPTVGYTMPLPVNYADSVYTAEVKYAEYVDMTQDEIDRYNRYTNSAPLPEQPSVSMSVITTNKKPSMLFSLSPLVYRNGKHQILVSYMLEVNASAANHAKASANGGRAANAERYAAHSVLASGRWGKIRVSSTGFHQLTEEVIKRAGLKNLSKVKIYGYGGNIVPEVLTDGYLREHDDLMEVPSVTVNGKRLFFARGPVSWEKQNSDVRTRNPYSDYGYYFITETDEEPLTMTEEEIVAKYYPDNCDYHVLHEVDNFAWYEGGRNLVEATNITDTKKYTIASPVADVPGYITVSVSCKTTATYSVSINGTMVGSGNMRASDYDKAAFDVQTYYVANLQNSNEVVIGVYAGGPLRLDYISVASSKPAPAPDLANGSFPAAEYVYNITNQDHHADTAVDLTIIIPTSQNMLTQAERLKAHHESFDGMSVRIVPADELYNEFSSGTPDVSAYRRYMKMMYDRSTSDADMPRYLLLFGDCMWDNRLLTSESRTLNADNLLLCHESENSYSSIYCYVTDDILVMLDDNEALVDSDGRFTGTPDVGVGRFPVLNEAQAKTIVDKTINYATNANVGAWQNTIMFMGDDGNNNLHMQDVDTVANRTARNYPGYNIRKVMWDAYKRVTSSTGNRFPEVASLVKAQQQQGALIMDYAGHGAPHSLSHEYVLTLNDFTEFTNANLPMWITASCDVGPFDGTEATIGETILTNTKGGGIGFFGTTRTVYANYNKYINEYFINYALGTTNGRRNTLGDANRLAKVKVVESGNDQTVNKVQYSLLGDPALALNTPVGRCVVDSIDGVAISSGEKPMVKANSKVRIKGHVEMGGSIASDMDGFVTVLVRDNEETLTCLMNDTQETLKRFEYRDRTKTLFTGTDSIRAGRFDLTFSVPRDINYSNENGLITLFAYSGDASVTAHGECDSFLVGGTEEQPNDSIGPSVYCYLNSTSFVNGQDVNATPYFVAEIKDKDGINASGAGVGHDMQLVIDNQVSMTYSLNQNFQFDFGTYTSGSTYYSIPKLSEGRHTLRFRVWDILNNPSTTTLTFNVVPAKSPELVDINVTKNPAKTTTTFIATHDRPGSEVLMKVEIFDMSGRLLHVLEQVTTTNSQTTALPWDLTTESGSRLQTGVYLYRVSVSGGGSNVSSKAKKLVVI